MASTAVYNVTTGISVDTYLVQDIVLYSNSVICLCLLKYSLYLMLKRRNAHHTATCPEFGATRCICRVMIDQLPWFYSDLYCDVVTCLGLISLSIYSLHFTNLLDDPFTGKQAFNSSRIVLCVALGSLSYRFVRLLLGPDIRPRFRCVQIKVILAMIVYVSIMVTSENAVIGVAGAFCQVPALFQTIHNITKQSGYIHETSAHSVGYVTSWIRTVSLITFSVIIPATYLSMALIRESPFVLSYYSLAVFMFSIPYFGILNVTDVIVTLVSTCNEDYLVINTEYSPLTNSSDEKTFALYTVDIKKEATEIEKLLK